MEFRPATLSDLPEIQRTYRAIIEDMDRNGIAIWDDVYPCEFFEGDILANRLYALFDDQHQLISAFALTDTNDGDSYVAWPHRAQKPIYIDRFGVNPLYARRGIGQMMLQHAMRIAKQRGADSLRLFVVDVNRPAISLYEKSGFLKADGIYHEAIDEDLILTEYGYESPQG